MYPLKTISLVAALSVSTPALAGSLTIDLKGVRASSGDLYIGLQKQDQFMKDGGSYGTIIKVPKPGEHMIVLKDVTPGEYHIGVWHDLDNDKKFSLGSDNIPTDGWSSYKAETLRAAPTWDEVKYTVPPGDAKVTVTMVYHQ